MTEETLTVYNTKYALTDGIKKEEVEWNANYPEMVSYRRNGYSIHLHGEGKQWHRTLPEAKVAAEKMRLRKIVSLKKQIARIEQLSFVRE